LDIYEASSTRTSFGKNTERLDSKQTLRLRLKSTYKILRDIRRVRKDIFLVAFKTTTDATRKVMYAKGLRLLKQNSANLVLVNDIHTGAHLIVTPEEYWYEFDDRAVAIENLCRMTLSRSGLTFERTTVVDGSYAYISELHDEGHIPNNFAPVLRWLITYGAFKPLPFTGTTTGHFGCRVSNQPYNRISSERKVNHNKVFKRGMVKIYIDGNGQFTAEPTKPSVGEITQKMIFDKFPDIDSIVHFHCEQKMLSTKISRVSQKEFECGSKECAMNAADHMEEIDEGIYIVDLDGHGPNIAFSRKADSKTVIEAIDYYFSMSNKTGGEVISLEEVT